MRLQGDNNRFEIVTTLNSDFIWLKNANPLGLLGILTRLSCYKHRFWVRHGHPKFIEISMAQIIAQFSCNGTYEPDTCDALLRRFQQAGPNGATTAWRHYLETDFAVIPSHEHFPYALATGRRAPSNSFFVPIHRVYMEIPSPMDVTYRPKSFPALIFWALWLVLADAGTCRRRLHII
jgi:hypothetical protein